jgi:23S rRNA pseudouridine1911/1915/1917 synthase
VTATQFRSETFRVLDDENLTLIQAFKQRYPNASNNDIKRLVLSGKLSVNGQRCLEPQQRLKRDDEVCLSMTTPRFSSERAFGEHDPIAYVDREVVVVRKVSGIASVAHADELTSTEQQVHRWLEQRENRKLPPLGVVHRLDKVTSGLMMFGRTAAAKRDLKDQFRNKTTGRLYLAVANGQLQSQRIAFRLARDRGDGLRGVTDNPELGRFSVTHINVLKRFSDCCLVQCRLETGRTHQIRIHLAELGCPIVGEPIYTKGLNAEFLDWGRTLLHAETLSFDHPRHRGRLEFTMPPPHDFTSFLDKRQPAREGRDTGTRR